MKKLFLGALCSLMFLTSCSALETIIGKSELSVQTQMSNTIVLEPVEPSQRVVYVDVRNTSGKKLKIEKGIKETLRENGYRVTDSPKAAHYFLRVNILRADVHDKTKSENYYYTDYTAVEAGLSALASNLVRDIYYELITDITVSEKTDYKVTQYTQNYTNQGRSGKRQTYSGTSRNREDYSTRVISILNKANLKFEEAIPELEKGLIDVISGIF